MNENHIENQETKQDSITNLVVTAKNDFAYKAANVF